jgi:hypothetical protein
MRKNEKQIQQFNSHTGWDNDWLVIICKLNKIEYEES